MQETNKEYKVKKLQSDWTNEPMIEDLDADYKGGASARITQIGVIDDYLDLLNAEGKYAPKKRDGRSSVQPKLAAKQASWRYSALSDPFLSNQDMFELSPRTFRDRKAAYENALILNYQFNVQMDKTKFINEYVRTAVDEGTVIVKTEWQFEERIVKEQVPVYTYEFVTDPMMAQNIDEAMQMQMEDPDQFLQLPEQIQESVLATAQNNRHTLATITSYEHKEFMEVVKDQPYWSVCDYKSITIDPTCQGDFSKAQFVIHDYETSIADLRKSNIYQNLDDIKFPANDDGTQTIDEDNGGTFQFQDDSRKKCTVHEYWGFWDVHGDGKTVPIIAAWVGDTMIRMEENLIGMLPFEVVVYEPKRKSVYGKADAPLIEDNQMIIGAVTRGMIDSMAKSANAQIGMRKDALDTVNKRRYKAGEDYEFNPSIIDSRAAIIEHSYPELPASTFNMLTMFNSEAEATTGIKSWTGGDSNLGSTATAVQGVLSAASKRELDILRRLASGLERLARKTMAMNALFLSDEIIVRITDEKFAQINRDNLKGSFDVKISISTADSDNIKAQELAFMLQTMGASLPFDLTKIILSEISKLRNMPDLAKMIEQYQPQPDPMSEAELQVKQAEAQLKMMEVELRKAQIQTEIAKAKKTLADATKVNLDTVEQEMGVTQERELQKQQAQAEGNAKRDIAKAAVDAVFKPKKESK